MARYLAVPLGMACGARLGFLCQAPLRVGDMTPTRPLLWRSHVSGLDGAVAVHRLEAYCSLTVTYCHDVETYVYRIERRHRGSLVTPRRSPSTPWDRCWAE